MAGIGQRGTADALIPGVAAAPVSKEAWSRRARFIVGRTSRDGRGEGVPVRD
jgi:hypothetical protein